MIDNKQIPLLVEIENIYQKLKQEALMMNYGYNFMDEDKVFQLTLLYKEAFDNYDKQITQELEDRILSEIKKEINKSIRYENEKLFLLTDKEQIFTKEGERIKNSSDNYQLYSQSYCRNIIKKVFSQLSKSNLINKEEIEILFEKLLKNWLKRIGKQENYLTVEHKNLQNIRKLFIKYYNNSFYDHILNQHLHGLYENMETFFDCFLRISKKDFSTITYLSSAYYNRDEEENIYKLNEREVAIYFNNMLSDTNILALYSKEEDIYEHLVDEETLELINSKEILFSNYSKMIANIQIKSRLYFLKKLIKSCSHFMLDNFNIKIKNILDKEDLLNFNRISLDKINEYIEIKQNNKEYCYSKEKIKNIKILNQFSAEEAKIIYQGINVFTLSNHIKVMEILKKKIDLKKDALKSFYYSFKKWYTSSFCKNNLKDIDITEVILFMNYIWKNSRYKKYQKINLVSLINKFNGDIFVQSINEKLISNIINLIIKNNKVNYIKTLLEAGANQELLKEMLTDKWGNINHIDPLQKDGETWFDICFKHSLFYLLEDLIKMKELPTFETDGHHVSTLKTLLLNNKTTIEQLEIYLNYLKEINKIPDFCDVLIRLKNSPPSGSHRLDSPLIKDEKNIKETIKKCLYCKDKYGISFFKKIEENKKDPLGKYHESLIVIQYPELVNELKLLGFHDIILKVQKEKQYVEPFKKLNIKEIKHNLNSGLNILDYPLCDYSKNSIYQAINNSRYIEILEIAIKNKDDLSEEEWESLFKLVAENNLNFIDKEDPSYSSEIYYMDVTSIFLNNLYYFDGIDEIAQKFLEYCVYDLRYTPSQKITYNNPKYSLIIDMLLKNRDKQELDSIIVNKNNIGIEKKKRL